MKKHYHYTACLRKQEKKLINQISDFEELECEQSLKILK